MKDDCCDLCMTSQVSVSRTTYCGLTIGVECGCDDSHKEGCCDKEDCPECYEGRLAHLLDLVRCVRRQYVGTIEDHLECDRRVEETSPIGGHRMSSFGIKTVGLSDRQLSVLIDALAALRQSNNFRAEDKKYPDAEIVQLRSFLLGVYTGERRPEGKA